MPFGVRSRIMKRPGVRLSRWTRPTHLSRVFMSAFSMSFQSSSPARIAAAKAYTSLNAAVASFASFAFSIGLPSAARSTASSGRNEVPVSPDHVGPGVGFTENLWSVGDGTSVTCMRSSERRCACGRIVGGDLST